MRVASVLAAFVIGTIFMSFVAVAWTGPTEAPTGGNIAAPVNIGTEDQIKNGGLGVDALAVYGSGTGSVLLGNYIDNRYGAISLNGIGLDNEGYNFTSSPTDRTLYINRPTGARIAFKEGNTGVDHLTISSGGNVGIGTTNPTFKLDVVGTVAANLVPFSDALGRDALRAIISSDNTEAALTCERNGVNNCDGFFLWSIDRGNLGDLTAGILYGSAFLYTSDARLKEDIESLQGGLQKILALNPVSFTWKEDQGEGGRDIGLIAQEVEKVVPQVVYTKDDVKNIDYAKLVPVLVAAIQEQQADNEQQQREINALRDQLKAIQGQP